MKLLLNVFIRREDVMGLFALLAREALKDLCENVLRSHCLCALDLAMKQSAETCLADLVYKIPVIIYKVSYWLQRVTTSVVDISGLEAEMKYFFFSVHCTIPISFLCSWLGFLEQSRIGVYRSIIVFLLYALTRFVSYGLSFRL